jgi:serine/threonine-protein kinase PknG
VLLMDFRFQSAYEHKLPPPSEQAVLAQHESLHRFLVKATASDPNRRFQLPDEMAAQLAGILHEVAAGAGKGRAFESELFSGDVMALRDSGVTEASADLLPDLKMDTDDKAAPFLLTTAGLADPRKRIGLLQQALPRFSDSTELPLRLARDLLRVGAWADAAKHLGEVEKREPLDWRVTWYRGESLLCQGKAREAQAAFDRVYTELPGEPAAKLAVALAAEAGGDTATASRLYEVVSRADPSFTTAAFGLARCLARTGNRAEAVSAYERVPQTSSLYTQAQMALARVLVQMSPHVPGTDELQRASAVIEALGLEGLENARLRAEVLENALSFLSTGAVAPDPAIRVLGQPFQETPLRGALEQALRQMARLAPDREQQIALVDRANAVRPVTWV